MTQKNRSKSKILLLEDDHDQLMMLTLLLEKGGHEVVALPSAENLRETLAHHSFAVIMCDHRMPGSSGVEVARTVRARPETKDTPFIILSASVGEDLIAAAEEIPGLCVLKKSEANKYLVEMVATLIASSSPPRG